MKKYTNKEKMEMLKKYFGDEYGNIIIRDLEFENGILLLDNNIEDNLVLVNNKVFGGFGFNENKILGSANVRENIITGNLRDVKNVVHDYEEGDPIVEELLLLKSRLGD